MLNKFRTFYRLPFRRQYLLGMVLLLSAYTHVLMKFFNKYARFGKRGQSASLTTDVANSTLIIDISYAIYAVNKHVPWESVCRHQAYQAKILCRLYRLPYQISVGVRRNDAGAMEGHAWTIAGGRMLTGFCNPDEYTVLNVYS